MIRVEPQKSRNPLLIVIVACLLLVPLLLFERQRAAQPAIAANIPTLSPTSGHYDHPILVSLDGAPLGSTLYYSVDGSDPTRSGQLYDRPIPLNEAGVTAIRAAYKKPSGRWSESASATYIVKLETSLPVLSMIADPADVWSQERGVMANPDKRGLDWEREVKLMFFEGDRSANAQQLAFIAPAGLRVHGSASRGYPKLSLRLYFRAKYGDGRLDYALYANQPEMLLTSFDRLILHGGSQDYATPIPDPRSNWTLLRSGLLYRLATEVDAYTTYSRPTLLFINGQSYGIYLLKTTPDETHLLDRYGVTATDMFAISSHPSSPNELQQVTGGGQWDSVLDFVRNNDIKDPSVYDAVGAQVNLNRYIDYVILEMYAGNKDWLRNNVRLFRNAETGRWNTIIWDVDQVFGLAPWGTVDVNMLDWLYSLETGGYFLQRLFENEQFKQQYLARLDQMLNGVLSAENTTQTLDQMAAEMRPDIHFETNIWSSPGDWEVSVAEMRDFVTQRPDKIRANHEAFFGDVPWK